MPPVYSDDSGTLIITDPKGEMVPADYSGPPETWYIRQQHGNQLRLFRGKTQVMEIWAEPR
jgi:hypothetical protein